MAVATSVLLLAAVVLATKMALTWWRGVRRMARVAASIPGPPTHPILGNFLDVPGRAGRIQPWFQAMIAKYGYLLRFWFGPKLLVCVIDAKDVEAVISSPSCAAKPDSAYRLLETVLGKGMASLNGTEHRRHRKMILPLLHRDMLAQFQPLMHLSALELADSLADKAASGEVFDASMPCGVAALNVTYRTILDVDQSLYEATRGQRRQVVESTTRVAELIWYRVVRPWRHPEWLFRLDPHHAELEQVIGLYDRLITDVLDDKLDKMSEPRRQQSRRSLLDILLASEGGRTLTREEVFAELKTMVAGTFATSMDVMSMVLLVLSLLPDELARIHRELDDVLGDRPLETADLDHLCALERLIREALRYYPPFPVLGRTCEKDLPLPSGHTLPAGCYIALCPLATQWHPEYYPRPEEFNPDRFLPEAAAARPACSFLPFSAGIRGCIGERYTFMLLKTCLATVLRRYDVLPDPDGPKDIQRIKMTVSITFHPKNGCKLRLRERQRPPAGGEAGWPAAAAAAVPHGQCDQCDAVSGSPRSDAPAGRQPNALAPCQHTHTHTQTHTQTHADSHRHTQTHTDTRRDTQTHTDTHTDTPLRHVAQ